MRKRIIYVAIVLTVIFGGTFLFDAVKSYFIKQFIASYEVPPVTVSTEKVTQKNWQSILSSVGTLTAVNGVDINSRVDGQIIAIYFKSGEMVKEGQPLLQIDDTIDKQALKNNQAQAQLDQITYQRYADLLKKNAVSRNDVDVARAKMIQSQSTADTAKLNIFYKNIKAPFSGKIGIRNVNIGQYVTAGLALVTLQSLDPLYVDFSLPQQDLKSLKNGQDIQITVDVYPGKIFKGKITAINSRVDATTRTLQVRGEIRNTDFSLYPGIFADVTIFLPEQKDVVVVPQTAVSYSLYGDIVYIVVPKGKDKKGNPILIATQRFVVLGERRGNEVVVLKGLKPGEEVVTTGQIKLNEGSKVTVNNSIKLD